MACRTVLRTVFLTEPWLPFQHKNGNSVCSSFRARKPSDHIFEHPICSGRSRDLYLASRIYHLKCSHNQFPESTSYDDEQPPPQEVVLKAISEVSRTEGRVGQTTNVVIGGTVTDDSTNEWLALDQKVNQYPTERGFTAIGTGGDDFVHAMVVAVESVLHEPVPAGRVKQKISSGGNYVSVNIGPVEVLSSEQVQAVYIAMRRDERMKYFL